MLWSKVKLLLSCDGADESTSFPDESDSNHTITAHDNAQVDTAQKKFGTGAILFDGTDDYLSALDSSDWNFGTGDFTIDFWIRFNSSKPSGYAMFLSQYETVNDRWILYFYPTIGIAFYSAGGSGVINFSEGNSNDWSGDTWYHVALVRNGNDWDIYRDGTSVASTTSSESIGDYNAPLEIGRQNEGGTEGYVDGWMDEIRIVKGVAVWTANFTPESNAYSKYIISGYAKLSGIGKQGINIRCINENTDIQDGEIETDGDGYFYFYFADADDTFHVCMDKATISEIDYNAESLPSITPVVE